MKIRAATLAFVILALLYLSQEEESPHVHLETHHLHLGAPT